MSAGYSLTSSLSPLMLSLATLTRDVIKYVTEIMCPECLRYIEAMSAGLPYRTKLITLLAVWSINGWRQKDLRLPSQES